MQSQTRPTFCYVGDFKYSKWQNIESVDIKQAEKEKKTLSKRHKYHGGGSLGEGSRGVNACFCIKRATNAGAPKSIKITFDANADIDADAFGRTINVQYQGNDITQSCCT